MKRLWWVLIPLCSAGLIAQMATSGELLITRREPGTPSVPWDCMTKYAHTTMNAEEIERDCLTPAKTTRRILLIEEGDVVVAHFSREDERYLKDGTKVLNGVSEEVFAVRIKMDDLRTFLKQSLKDRVVDLGSAGLSVIEIW